MGGTSTLQSAVLKDGVSTPTSFDLRSWQGLTLVLKTGKEFLTEPGAYAEFRNLVLQYAQQGGDVEIKKQIDAIIATFGKPVAPKSASAPAPIPTSPAVSTVEVKSDEPMHSTKKEKTTTQKVIGRRIAPRFGTHDADISLVTTPRTPEVAPQSPEVAAPTTPDTPQVVDIAPASIIEEPESTRSAPKTLEEHRARIAEIKRAVHEHIGNPVALMGTKDGKGKEYMTALLTALKSTGAGAGGGADGAMHALEKAYAELVDAHAVAAIPEEKAHGSVAVSTNEEIAKETLEPIEQKSTITTSPPASPSSDIHMVEDVLHEEVDVVPTTTPVSVDAPRQREAFRTSFKRSDTTITSVVSAVLRNKRSEEETLSAVLANKNVVSSEEEKQIPTPPVVDIPAPAPVPEVVEEVNQSKYSVQDTLTAILANKNAVPPEEEKQIPTPPVVEIATPNEKVVDEVREVRPLVSYVDTKNEVSTPAILVTEEDIEEKQALSESAHNIWSSRGVALSPTDELVREVGIDPKEVVVKQSELSSPDISQMLDTLLHEWSIFSGSGIFGIGPGGLSHPLFRRLAPLSMGEVLAGRWEGTNPKIVKVIKEYVDAWRHEQSITFTVNETFEHYLRRVVQRIIKRQNGG